MRVLLFGTYDAAVHPRIAVLADGLRAHGVDVDEVNAPLGFDTAARVAMLRQPWRVPLLAVRLARCWAVLVRGARAELRRPGAPAIDAVLVGYLGHFDVLLARRLFPRTPVVLDHLIFAGGTARDRGASGSVLARALGRLDRAALRAADVVVVDTDEHRDEVPADLRPRAVVVPVGAPQAWFAAAGTAPAQDRTRGGGPLKVVFFGLFTPLQGAVHIGATLARLAGPLSEKRLEVTMIGHGQDLAAARAAAGGAARAVTWTDWIPPGELPEIVAAHDVCLGIVGTTPKARRVVPNKVFQGAAAGCAVVTSDTAPQRRVLGDAAVLVPPGDPQALADALLALADDRTALTRTRDACASLAADRFRADRIVLPLLDRLRSQGTTPVPAPPAAPEVTAVLDPVSAAQPAPAPPTSTEPPLAPGAALRWDVVRRLLPPDARDLLEIGCGQGAFGARLATLVPRYLGIEPDPTSYAVARKRVAATGGGEVRNLRTDELPADDRYDVVCAFEVLEHLEDDRGALAEWAGRLRPGGTLLISTPAGSHRLGAWDELVGHYRRYDAAGMSTLLRESGLVDVDVRLYGFPLGFALENARNVIARRRLAAGASHVGGADHVGEGMADRTASSGRQLQPTRPASALAVRAATAPFLRVQRRFPQRGTALVAVGHRPS